MAIFLAQIQFLCVSSGYLGCVMFIMRRVDQREAVDVVGTALDAYNRDHAVKGSESNGELED